MIKQFYIEYSYLIENNHNRLYFIGLYLLHLLSNNRITEYCFELEHLSLLDFSNNFISFVIEIQHCITEGNFNKLLSLKSTMSDPGYIFYLNKLSHSLRYQIAKSAERSFRSINVNSLLELLRMQSNSELIQFIEKEIQKEESDIQWIINDNKVIFKESSNEKGAIPSRKILSNTVNLAKEIEKIV